MKNRVNEILQFNMKHKEKVALLVEKAREDAAFLLQVVDLLRTASDIEKGTAAEVLKFVSADAPQMMFAHIDVLIDYIDYKAPRVRWGCPEALGNLARTYPGEVERAIPKLLGNLEDHSTVVRWCAAYALAQIPRYNKGKQTQLVQLFIGLAEKESNNGVRNVFVKAINEIARPG